MVVGVTMRYVLAASAIAAAASAKRGMKRRRRTLLTPCGGRNGVDDAVGGTSDESCCAQGFGVDDAVGGTSDESCCAPGFGVDDAVGGTSDESCCAPGFGVTRHWSGLPDPAVHLILTALLPSLKDAFSLGSVCRAWRSVFAAGKRHLFSALPPLLVDRCSSPRALGGFYCLRERRFHRRKHNSDFWRWTYRRGRPLRPRMDVIGVSHGYWIVRAVPPWCKGPSPVFLIDPLLPEVRIHLPRAPHHVCYAVMTAPPASPDCVVVLMEFGRILYCRPGDTQWVRHSFVEGGGGDNEPSFVPSIYLVPHLIAIVGGKLYTLCWSGKVVIVELLPRPKVAFLETKLLPPEQPLGFLMESNGEILLVEDVSERKLQQLGPADVVSHGLHQCSEEHKFIVRRLDVAAQEWVTLSTLGDRCLFLKWGATCATSVAPARWGGEGDCIYTFCTYSSPKLLVFHMKDGWTEHHRMPKECQCYDWLTPSFCYL